MNDLHSVIRTDSYFSKSCVMLYAILSIHKLFLEKFFRDKFKFMVFEILFRQITSVFKSVVIFGIILSSQIIVGKVEASVESSTGTNAIENRQSVNPDFLPELPSRSDAMTGENAESLPLLRITAPTIPTIESAGIVNFIISTNAMSNPGILRVRYDPSEVMDDFLNQNAPLSQEAPVSRAVRFGGSTGDFKGTLRVRIHDDLKLTRIEMVQIQVTLLADNASPTTYRINVEGSDNCEGRHFR